MREPSQKGLRELLLRDFFCFCLFALSHPSTHRARWSGKTQQCNGLSVCRRIELSEKSGRVKKFSLCSFALLGGPELFFARGRTVLWRMVNLLRFTWNSLFGKYIRFLGGDVLRERLKGKDRRERCLEFWKLDLVRRGGSW